VFDRGRRRLEIFASPYAELIDRHFAATRAVTYRSRDGLTIHGYLTLPPGQPERALPLVVMPHGGPFLRDSWTFDPQVQFLASRGYAVLQANFRGSTGYGRDFVARGPGQLGTGMITDLDDGVDWLAGQGIVDRARVCIMGSSYGGYAAIWGAMRSPERYRCAISFAGPSDIRAMVRYDRRFFSARRYAREFEQRIAGEDGSDLNAISPVRHPEMLRVPALIAHGEQDTTVPVDQSRNLVRALQRTGAAIETVFYPKSAHGFTDQGESADYLRRVEAFLARHNPAGPAPAPAASAPVPAAPAS
jgi:dipeptidyl aminopeptidase/acylaminoacyl peptidase